MGESLHGASLCGTADDFTVEASGPLVAYFTKTGGADVQRKLDAAQFEFTFEGGGGELREVVQRSRDQDDFVALPRVPQDPRNAFFEKGDGIHVAEKQVARNAGEIAFVVVLDGEEAVRQQAKGLRGPTKIICERNFVMLAKCREQIAFRARARE